MSVKHYSAKLEFQRRGVGHDHGILWVNMKKIEFMMDTESQGDHCIEYHLQDLSIHFEITECTHLQRMEMSLLVCKEPTALDNAKKLKA